MALSTPAVLFLAHVFKGNEAFRAARALGFRPILLTTSALLHEPWDRDALGEVLAIPDLADRPLARLAAGHLARSWRLSRVVAVDDPGVDLAADLREHLCLPGLGASAARLFRDKLAMRLRANERGVPVPAFSALFSDEEVRAFVARVPAPWIVKPRKEASSRGIRKVANEGELWAFLGELAERRGDYLVERFVRGPLFHVDAITAGGRVLFAEAHAYERPLLEVVQGGDLMVTRTVPPTSALAPRLLAENERIVGALGLVRGVTHTELLLDEDDRLVFVESAARVAGAHIHELVEASTGVRLWDEHVRLELGEEGDGYAITPTRRSLSALLVGLSRHARAPYETFADEALVWTLDAPWQAGLVLRHDDTEALDRLVAVHRARFVEQLAR